MVQVIHFRTFVIIVVIYVRSSEQVGLHHTAGDFCYSDDVCDFTSDKWNGLCKTGDRQSPINIPASSLKSIGQKVAIDVNGVYRQKHQSFFIRNNGHTIQIQLEKNQTSGAFATGIQIGNSNKRYIFAQMHFHWGDNDQMGSEHEIDGKSAAMEIHFVHYSNEYESIVEASLANDSSALGVIGVLVQPSLTEPHNPSLASILAQTPRKYMPNPFEVPMPMNLSSFLPPACGDNWAKVFRYPGSLTTPPCSEFVLWAVMLQPIYFHPDEIEAFRTVEDEEGFLLDKNDRPVQKRTDLGL